MIVGPRPGATGGSVEGAFRGARGARPPCGLAVVAVSLLSVSAVAAPDFELIWQEPDGLTLESRATAGTNQPELRVRVQVAATPRAVAEVVWSQGPGPDASRYLERRDILLNGPNVRLEHHVVALPVLGRREVILRYTRQDDALGSISIEYASGGPGDGLPADAPRMTLLRGAWHFTTVESGRVWVEFCSVSDPGGLPAILAIGPQRLLAVALVRDAVRRATVPPKP